MQKVHKAILVKLISSILFLFVADGYCQSHDSSRIDKTDLRAFMKILTADSLEGRAPGSIGHQRAEQFIAKRFNDVGLIPFNSGSYLEQFDLVKTYWNEIYIKTPTKQLTNFEEMFFQGNHPENTEVEKEVVFGGTGTSAELDQINCEGRYVLVFVKNLRSHYGIDTILTNKKALGVVVANPDNDNQFASVARTFKDFALQKRLSVPGMDTTNNFLYAKFNKHLNNIAIANSAVRSIMGLGVKQLNLLIATNRIKDSPVSKIKVKFEKIQETVKTTNVVGLLKGTTDRVIIISAHYDHLGQVGNDLFAGADDNASGVAAMLELAEEFSQRKGLRYNLVFIATSAEEGGLLGSQYHVAQPGFKAENVVCNFNIDMIGRIDGKHRNGKYLYCIGAASAGDLKTILNKVDDGYDRCTLDYSLDDSKDPMGLFTRSDSYTFYKKGIPSIHFFSGFHDDYHKATDTVNKIDFNSLEDRVRMIALLIEKLVY